MTKHKSISKSDVYVHDVEKVLDSGQSVSCEYDGISVFAQGYANGVYLVYREIDNKEISSMFPDTENAALAFHALVHTKRDVAVVSLPWDDLVRKSFAASYSKLFDMLGSGHTTEIYSFADERVRFE